MDPFAHFTLGATIGTLTLKDSFSFLGDDLSLLISFFIGGFIGILPDIDILYKGLVSNIRYLEVHRTWTHSIFSHLILSIILTYFFCHYSSVQFELNLDTISFFRSIFLILFSHVFLDALTSWGVFYFYPFKIQWAFKSVSVIDLPFNLLMLIQVVFLLLQTNTYVCFYIACFYLILNLILRSTLIIQTFKSALAKHQITYSDIFIKPIFSNTIIWTCQVKSGDIYYTGYYHILQKRDTVDFFSHSQNNLALIGKSEDEIEIIERIKKISGNWVSYTKKENIFHINDIRYGFKTLDQNETRHCLSYEIIRNNNGQLDVQSKIKLLHDWYKLMWNKLINF